MTQFVENLRQLQNFKGAAVGGSVRSVRRDAIRLVIPDVQVGSVCKILTRRGPVTVEIVSLGEEAHIAMPLDELKGVQLGDPVVCDGSAASVPVSDAMLGDVVDSLGHSYIRGEAKHRNSIPLYDYNMNPLERELIESPLDLGIRAVNAALTCGRGQRQGIFAGSGVGKSVLLGMMAQYTSADVVVIGLIGERGREVREFLERDLGESGRKKSIVVVETAEKSAVRRARGAFSAAAIADHFRQQGAQVLLMMDSVTRFAMAQREIGMAAGEAPTTKGYTASVFSSLARLFERAGNWGSDGSITGLYTVLVEGDDLEDPVADSVRSLLDGHIVLSRKIANRGQYPAIDVLSSVSRTMDQVVDPENLELARRMKRAMALYEENEDAILYRMYEVGSNPELDEAIRLQPIIRDFLSQNRTEGASLQESFERLRAVFSGGAE